MKRFAALLPFLAFALLLAAAVPTLADPGASNPAPTLDLKTTSPSCEATPLLPSPPTEIFLQATTNPGFILCTCKLCTQHPAVICQVSPSGFSIHCSDWALTHC